MQMFRTLGEMKSSSVAKNAIDLEVSARIAGERRSHGLGRQALSLPTPLEEQMSLLFTTDPHQDRRGSRHGVRALYILPSRSCWVLVCPISTSHPALCVVRIERASRVSTPCSRSAAVKFNRYCSGRGEVPIGQVVAGKPRTENRGKQSAS